MDTEQFQSAKLGHLDFEFEQKATAAAPIPLPDELPKRADISHLPKEIQKSSTVENLISQNEDLMARLKVAIRRLSLLETENTRLSEESHKARLSQSSVTDQILVWREKDNMWKHKVDLIEREKEIATEKMRALEIKVKNMMADLVRHQKYHDRIKTQVKPYITQLKDYSAAQDIRVSELESDLNHKEALLRDLRHQVIEVTKNARYQVETSDKKSQEMVQHYEDQIASMSKELQVLHQAQEDLEVKTAKLHSALERQDTLENELVVVRRSKEEIRHRLEAEIQRQQERMSELTRQNQKLGVEHADLQIRVVQDNETIQTLEKENRQYFEQLESLRYMWNAKNEENEKLKAAAAALERLNLELSQKLNDIRRQES
jgi:chromosome segregation ATPase